MSEDGSCFLRAPKYRFIKKIFRGRVDYCPWIQAEGEEVFWPPNDWAAEAYLLQCGAVERIDYRSKKWTMGGPSVETSLT